MKLLNLFSLLQVFKNLMPITKEKPMRTISQCGQCGAECNGMVELKDHIRKVHIPERLIKFSKPVVDEGEPKVIEIKPVENIKEQETTIAKEVPPPVPIVLEYKYVGVDTCGESVVTLEVDVGDKHFVIAYCPKEQKQIEVREVAKLYDNKKMSDLSESEEFLSQLPKKK